MASKAQILNRLERAIGITPQALSDFIDTEIESAFSFVEEEFNRILEELQHNSVSGSLAGYSVETHRDTQSIRLPRSRRSINLPRMTVFVESPDASLNVFDILDTGRKQLPAKSQGAYPMWSLRNPTLTATSSRRDPATGRFAFSLAAQSSSGIRRAEDRDSLKGAYPSKPENRPIVWSKGPIKAVEPRNLYDRISENALKKLRNRSLRTIGLVRVPRSGQDG